MEKEVKEQGGGTEQGGREGETFGEVWRELRIGMGEEIRAEVRPSPVQHVLQPQKAPAQRTLLLSSLRPKTLRSWWSVSGQVSLATRCELVLGRLGASCWGPA